MTAGPAPAVVCPRQVERPGLRLYLLHHAGGSHTIYRPWLALLPPDWDVRLVIAPGRSRAAEHPPVTDLRLVTEAFAEQLRADAAADPTPYALFGHSMGALTAFGAALDVCGGGDVAPIWVGISGHPGPWHSITGTRPPLFGLAPAALRAALADLDGLPERVLRDSVLWDRVQPMVRADLQAAETWVPHHQPAVLPVPMSAYCGDRDPVAGPADAENWAAHSTAFGGVRVFPGGHFYHQPDPAPVVAAVVADLHAILPTAPAIA